MPSEKNFNTPALWQKSLSEQNAAIAKIKTLADEPEYSTKDRVILVVNDEERGRIDGICDAPEGLEISVAWDDGTYNTHPARHLKLESRDPESKAICERK